MSLSSGRRVFRVSEEGLCGFSADYECKLTYWSEGESGFCSNHGAGELKLSAEGVQLDHIEKLRLIRRGAGMSRSIEMAPIGATSSQCR